MTVCEEYGMTAGCDENCPALLDGKCPIQDEIIEILKERGIDVEL